MLSVPWPEPFEDPEWRFELKWDGVRALVFHDGAETVLRSRAGNDVSDRYPELRSMPISRPVVVDGEIISLDDSGRPSFERLQQRMGLSGQAAVGGAVSAVPISFVAFDVLYDGGDLTRLPWQERRRRLLELDLPAPCIVSEVFDDAAPVWEFVLARGIEGIMAKRLGSPYRPGARSSDWRKIAAFRTVRAVVGGFTAGSGGRHGSFGALVLGLWAGDRLRWIGSVGSGFSDAAIAAIRETLDQERIAESPFIADRAMPVGVSWVSPRLVAMVQFKEWTAAGRLRAPSFKGFTDDAPAYPTWETEGPAGVS